MNNFELSILTLLHYNVLIRDTLEYTMNGRQFELKAYEYKKNGIKVEIEQPTALKQFIDKNKELGDKVVKEINDLYDGVYSADSTICKVANDELRVDESQHIAVYDLVLPLREDIKTVINAHINYGRQNNLITNDIMQIVVADERMYRAVCFSTLFHDLAKSFIEYNKARNEAKGAITPQSNFIQGEIVKITNNLKFVIQNLAATDTEIWDIADYLERTINQTAGRRLLPTGKTFKDVFDEGDVLIRNFLSKTETSFKSVYDPAINELIKISKENKGQIKFDIKSNDKKDEKKEA